MGEDGVSLTSSKVLKELGSLPEKLDRQLVVSEVSILTSSLVEDTLASDKAMDSNPLCIITLDFAQDDNISYWVLHKVDEVKDCVRVSCEGSKEQLKAFLVAIKVGQPSLVRSASKKDRELKRLSSSINNDGRGGNALRSTGKEWVAHTFS